MITNYHAKYYAHELGRVGGTGVDRIGRALFDACVDLNPHQIEAALFALRSPLSKGVLLADEVGLGKTIEAGLVLCQYWAERKRNILVICPASLRKQWALELSEKFNLPTLVLDAKTFNDQQKNGTPQPFKGQYIIICSMHYASGKAEDIREICFAARKYTGDGIHGDHKGSGGCRGQRRVSLQPDHEGERKNASPSRIHQIHLFPTQAQPAAICRTGRRDRQPGKIYCGAFVG